jgi:hypothetical protein
LKGAVLRSLVTTLISTKLHRYTSRQPRYRKRIPPDWVVDDSLLSDLEFKALYRMARPSFYLLLDRIARHEIFISTSAREQRPAKLQLQVMLYHFGSSGSCRVRTSLVFQIGKGSVDSYVRRCMTAILSLRPEFLHWPRPNSNDYRTIVRRHQLEYGLPNVLSFVDGTIVPAYRKPVEQGESYYTRKSCYGLHTTLVVDSTCRIIYAFGALWRLGRGFVGVIISRLVFGLSWHSTISGCLRR